ncbi:metallophosphoesterase, partial [Candidatus Pacearchaeota archaeon]|nr:metallophosphoesterase [Candidatus Pacearchaeota archaeon]
MLESILNESSLNESMKVLIVGDPHGDISKIKKSDLKKADLILITGDIGKADLARKQFFENLKRKREGLPELEKDAKFEKKVRMEIYDSTLSIVKELSRYAPVYSILGNV